MSHSQELVARTTLRIAGVFQEISEAWMRRLDVYFSQLDTLVNGEWLGPEDLRGILKESKMAAREALNGLGNDLSAQLVHESSGLFTRFEIERNMLKEKISELQSIIDNFTSKDEYLARKENQELRRAIFNIPDFQVLHVLERIGQSSYSKLVSKIGINKRKLKKIVESLTELGYAHIDTKTRPYVISYISAPWETIPDKLDEMPQASEFQETYSLNEEYNKLVEGPS